MNNRIVVDWPLCQARGLCHELLPDVIQLDPWLYPIVVSEVSPADLDAAREAVNACPRRALKLIREG
ncbi:MAG TPA: ferredoxin [Marmoricola sp.]|nr:ferredoxin [Marmoricola sp.]